MNKFTTAIASFIRFDNAIINTLEYVMKKDKYDIKAYDWRRGLMNSDITNNTPLKSCLDHSGEAGEKLTKAIKDMLELIYSDTSTIVKKNAEGTELRVDEAQHLAIYQAIMPIHDEMRNVIYSFIVQAKKENAFDEPQFEELIQKQEAFYRGLVNLLLLDDFDHLFAEYNKARQEAKGEITPQSNFIQNDLNEVSKLIAGSRQRSPLISTEYYEVIDPIFALMEMTQGRRQLPEGKNFGDMFINAKTIARDKTIVWENAFKPAFEEFNKKFDEEIKKIQAQQEANKAA